MKVINIVAATTDDIGYLLDIQTECGLSPWTLEGYELELRRADSIILVAKEPDGHIVGFIVGRAPSSAEDQAKVEADIYNIATRRAFQNRGIGSLLLGRFIRICNDRNIRTIWLEVRASNQRAIVFYSSHGFVPSGTRRSFYSGPLEDAQIMALKLGDGNTEQRHQDA